MMMVMGNHERFTKRRGDAMRFARTFEFQEDIHRECS